MRVSVMLLAMLSIVGTYAGPAWSDEPPVRNTGNASPVDAEGNHPQPLAPGEQDSDQDEMAGAGQESPRLSWSKPVMCLRDQEGEPIRVQCRVTSDEERNCLVAPDRLLVRPFGRLERVRSCQFTGGTEHYVALEQEGYRMIPAIAEAPPGWHRDRFGRVVQVTFDLMDRFYLGGGWAPAGDLAGGTWSLDRGHVEMGFVASLLDRQRRSRHTFRAVEGRLALSDLEGEALLFAYDYSHAGLQPAFFITTFFGEPRRYDVFADLGFGLRLLDLAVQPHRTEDLLAIEYLEAHGALDIWQSQDLYSHVRLAAGLGLEGLHTFGDRRSDSLRLAPDARIETRLGLDSAGFHYLDSTIWWALPIALDPEESTNTATRLGAQAGYEVILLAIDNQPLSMRVEAGLDYRDDLGPYAPEWDAHFLAGLRFSMWAPPRVEQSLAGMAGEPRGGRGWGWE